MAKFGIAFFKDKAVKTSAQNSGESSSSRIAGEAYIQGDLEFSGSLYFAGKLAGSIQAGKGNLELSKSGQIHGNIHCYVLDCYGRVVGDIQADDKIILRDDCQLTGDILTRELLIQSGAQISGCCKMLGEAADMDFFSIPIENLRKQLKLEKPVPLE